MNWKWLLIWVIGGTIILYLFKLQDGSILNILGLIVYSVFCAIMGTYLRK